jgi:O-antigen biosynthesis protein WbqP
MSAYAYVKRALDCALAALLLAVLSPVFALVAVAVRATSPGPALFRQRRIGRGGREFLILKFRTMRSDTPRDTATHLLSDPGRCITRVGRFLRRSSLDELPQLLNVVRGDMSLVGPRPALYNQYDLIAARDALGINAVRPGITGWAQINGRDELPIADKVRYDAEYVGSIGLRMDLKCLLGSVLCVLRGSGVREGRAGGRKSA